METITKFIQRCNEWIDAWIMRISLNIPRCLACHRLVSEFNPTKWNVGGIGVTGCWACSGVVKGER